MPLADPDSRDEERSILRCLVERGWGGRDSRSAMLLQMERAGVGIKVPAENIDKILKED